MRAFTPEISWHNRLPALSLDISQPIDGISNQYRVATGGNDCRVYIWLIDLNGSKLLQASSNPDIRILAGLRRHQKSVGAVRFSSQHFLASGDDDGYIYIWKHKAEDLQQQIESNTFMNDDGFEDLEVWQQQRVLRGHIEDICDLAWSKDGQFLLSGSVDNSAILWDTTKGSKIWCSDLIKGYVQGVAIDPHCQFMTAISSDRTLRVYNFTDKRLLNATRRVNIKGNYKAFFCDDTVQTFCRRLEFSPDGQFLLTPTSKLIERVPKRTTSKNGSRQDSTEQPINVTSDSAMDISATKEQMSEEIEVVEIDSKMEDEKVSREELNNQEQEDPKTPVEQKDEVVDPQNESQETKQSKKPINVVLVFRRSSFNKPIHYYPVGREAALCIRFSPVLYKLRNSETNFWGIPYRIVFAVATARSILIYDSQTATPIGYASQIHLARITDIAWSNDGRLLMISSYDGYSTLLTFDKDEFGEVYTGPMLEAVTKPSEEEKVEDKPVVDGKVVEEKPSRKGQKRSKASKEAVPAKKEKLITDDIPEVDNQLSSEQQATTLEDTKSIKRATLKKITPTKVPERATIMRFLVKKN